MTYAADFALSGNAAFQNQVQMAMVKAAEAVKSEARTIHPNVDSKRQALCDRIFANETGLMAKFVNACIETGLSGTPTDAQVDSAISAIFSELAGVTPQDAA